MHDVARHSGGERAPPVALITGATGGVGRRCTLALAEAGYETVIVGRDTDGLKSLADEAWRASRQRLRGSIVRADLVDKNDLEALCLDLERRGKIDVFLSAAGITSNNTAEFEDDELERVMALNVFAPMFIARRVVPLMKQANKGYILNLCSRAAIVGFADKGVYGASKAAALRFFDSLYAGTLETGIRATSICPGWINTRMAVAGGSKKAPDEMLQADDISSLVTWLVATPARVRIREIVVEAGGARLPAISKRSGADSPSAHGGAVSGFSSE